MKSQLVDALTNYLEARKLLLELKNMEFPVGCAVVLTGGAQGMVVGEWTTPNQLAIRFENGNVWHKSIDECERIPWAQANSAIRLIKLRRHGISVGVKGGL